MTALAGQVALVAGATRGAGRGIAIELGAAGATVYCTGRTTRDHRSPYNRPETIEETAEMVGAAGGLGIAVQVDHAQIDQVRVLVERIDREQDGRLDVLVNDIWGGEGFLGDYSTPFWKHDLAAGLQVLHNAVDTHIITSWHVAPLMIRRPRGLIVGITDGRPDEFHDHLFYDLPKKSVMRMAVAHAAELGRHGVTGVAISPGFLRSEMMLDEFGVTEDTWQEAYWRDTDRAPIEWLSSESPRYTGRAIVALATDPDRDRWNGKTMYTSALAPIYGFTDLDGTMPGHGIYDPAYLGTHDPQPEEYALD